MRERAVVFRASGKGVVAVLLLSCFLTACGSSPNPAARPADPSLRGGDSEISVEAPGEVGIASWYGVPYHGRTTASGETYDMNDLTAAHRSLSFGARVRVTNLENGRSLVLRVNDRGPFVKRRIIDVSKRAARELGFLHDGLARVRVEVL